MMAISLEIPTYKGGYRMDADALQAEMIELRDCIVGAVLTEDERREITNRMHEQHGYASFDRVNEAWIARVQELLPERLDRKDAYNWPVSESIEKFNQLRAEMEREYGLVR